ncbi:uncharacterized protein LOC144125144 isoform X1 [Amblyomma americanum]
MQPRCTKRDAMTARIVDGVLQSPFPACDYQGISMPELVRSRLELFANKVIAVDVDAHLTGGELLSRIRRCAAGFSREGLQKGSRVCCQVGNSLDNIVAAMGVVFAGGTLVMARTTSVERELRYEIEDSTCEWILTDVANSSKASQVMEKIPLKACAIGEVPGFINVTKFQSNTEDSWREADVPVDPNEDVIVILYTSGSTGLPKGVEITHKAYVSTFLSFSKLGFVTEGDVFLAWNPITHVSGFTLNTFGPCCGATTILREITLPLDKFVDVVQTYKVTSVISLPIKLQMLINEAKSTRRKLPHIDKIMYGGSPMSSSLCRDICDVLTPSTLANVYGMTETFGLVSATQVDEITTDHMGLPTAGCEVKVVDVNTGKLLEPFEQGEICVRSPHVMKCYHRRPEATADVLSSDGWLRTGDLGHYDREGHLYMVERLKQLIKCMDNQLAPSELEEILLTHDAVAEVAVVGVPSPKYGEAPAACVVLNASYAEPHSTIEEELKKLVAGQTAVYKYLYGGVIFLDSLPKAENGKILKKELLAKFADRPIP